MRYRYAGPMSAVTLALEGGQATDIVLTPGAEIDLPPQHPYVVTLLARGHLTPIPTPPPAVKAKKEG